MIRAAAWLVATAFLLYSYPGQAQTQQPQLQQQPLQLQMQQLSLEQRQALQLPGTLVVETLGRGGGSVQSVAAPGSTAAPMIDCGRLCEYTYRPNDPREIHLRAVPGPGALFVFWSGACGGHGLECVVHGMSSDARQRVLVSFIKPHLTVKKHGQSQGVITGPQLDCGASIAVCTQEYNPVVSSDGSRVAPIVTLHHNGPPGAQHWFGCDGGSGVDMPQCKVTLTGYKEVTVTLPVLRMIKVHKQGDGTGEVYTSPRPMGACDAGSAPVGTWCALYEEGTEVGVTASGQFVRWVGEPCSAQRGRTCGLRITGDTEVWAEFERPAPPRQR